MQKRRRKVRQGPQHVGALQQVRPGQTGTGELAHAVAKEQHIEVHGARGPLRRVAFAPAGGFDGVQLRQHFGQRQGCVEGHHQIVEIFALETEGGICVARRHRQLAEGGAEPGQRLWQPAGRVDIAAGGNEHARHCMKPIIEPAMQRTPRPLQAAGG